MTVTAYTRGHQVFYINNKWRYADGTTIDKHRNPCTRCGQSPTSEGYDAIYQVQSVLVVVTV